jgi:DNA-binding transcriptional regulator PaaX
MIEKSGKIIIGNIKTFLNSEKKSAKVTKVILAVLAVGGILIIGAMAPNIFQAFGRYKQPRRYSPKTLRNGLYSLKKKGLVEIIRESGDKTIIRLTIRGESKIKELSADIMEISKMKKWDKKWRIVIFDIPDKYKKAREALRRKLIEWNFYKLQESVWAYPYPCEDEVLFICHVFGIENFIDILTVEELLHQDKLQRHFKL